MQTIHKGLEGILVDDSSISEVDGAAGTLRYRGYPIEELVELPFEAVAWLVFHGELPADGELGAFQTRLHELGQPSAAQRAAIEAAPDDLHPMCILQGLVATHPPCTGDDEYLSPAARLPMLAAYLLRWRLNRQWPDYPASVDLCQRMLQIMDAQDSPEAVSDLRLAQILQIEHGFNAGTFTARVVTSTRAPFPNAAAAALGALYGPLHGGADEAALQSAQDCGDAAKAESFVNDMLGRGERVMGMGHREYRVVDPRALLIKPVAVRSANTAQLQAQLETLVAIEREFRKHMNAKGRELHANVDFYKGIVYSRFGIPTSFFTPMFAAARVFGYAAHAREQARNNRLIRPAANYAGVAPRSMKH